MDALVFKSVFKFGRPFKKSTFFSKLLFQPNKAHLQTKAEKHFFKTDKTRSQLVQEIVDNVTYKSDNFIVTNKPLGLAKKILNKENYEINSNEYYIEDLLPEVSTKLGYDSLTLIKAPEKNASGVMFLSTSNEGFDEVLNAISHIKKINLYNYTYLVITEHPIVLKQLKTKLGIQKVKDDSEVVPYILEKWSKKKIKEKYVKTFLWNHKVVAESDLASLVLVNLNLGEAYVLKLVLATKCYSPVLGDNLFRYRVKHLLGVPLLDDPKKCSKTPQKLKPKLLSALQIQDDEVHLIPLHVHLLSVQLQLNKKKIFVSVPPPESFDWTCKQLNLIYDDLKVFENYQN